jgi:uncharacterized protein YkwD
VRSVCHALSAAALAAVALGALTACNDLDLAVLGSTVQAAAAVPAVRTTTPGRPIAALAARPIAATPTTRARPAPSRTPRTTTTPTTPPPPTQPSSTGVAGQILTLVNAQRTKAGCKAVTLDARLTAAAAGHAEDMAANDYFSHTSLDGRSFVDRIKAAGYPVPRSENIAAGQPTPAAVMDAWMASAGHRANILDCSAVAMGAASAQGGSYGIYWVQDFGR